MMPQFSRLDPIEGIGRMFAMRSFIELAKASRSSASSRSSRRLVLWKDAPTLMALGREPLQQAIGHAVQISGKALLVISCGLLIIAGIDVPYQLWQYAKQMRMSREKSARNTRKAKARPKSRAASGRCSRQLRRQRMMQEVPKADVVVDNPTHFAVALQVRREAHARADRGREGRRRDRREDPRVAGEHAVPIFEARRSRACSIATSTSATRSRRRCTWRSRRS
jgi:flagellar biosynthetic protein FlhB